MLCLIGFLYGLTETLHYGSHFIASCDAEVIADGLTAIIISIGLTQLYKE